MASTTTHSTPPANTHKDPPKADPKAEVDPHAGVTDSNASASAADKDWFKRKNHGGTGA